jgi:transposase
LSTALFIQLYDEFGALEKRLASYTEKLEAIGATHPVCQRLGTVPGIGPLTATALVAAVSDASHFKNGRQFAAWLGLVPRQHSTGGKPRLLGISKRGNRYLRKNLIHGARAVLPYLVTRDTPLARWARGLLARTHKNVVVVALANKLARIAWAVLAHGRIYEPAAEAAA